MAVTASRDRSSSRMKYGTSPKALRSRHATKNAARVRSHAAKSSLMFWGASPQCSSFADLTAGILYLPCFLCNGTKVAGCSHLYWRGVTRDALPFAARHLYPGVCPPLGRAYGFAGLVCRIVRTIPLPTNHTTQNPWVPYRLDSVLRESNAQMCAMSAAPECRRADEVANTRWRKARRGVTLVASSPPKPPHRVT
jgi:hypothetical protein